MRKRLKTQMARLKRAAKRTLLGVSAVTHQNVDEVLRALLTEIDAQRQTAREPEWHA